MQASSDKRTPKKPMSPTVLGQEFTPSMALQGGPGRGATLLGA